MAESTVAPVQESLTQTQEEVLPEEGLGEITEEQPELTKEEEITVELSQPTIEGAQQTLTVTQMEQMQVEGTEEITTEVTEEKTTEEEITVDLGQHTIEKAHGTLVAAQLEKFAEELTGDIVSKMLIEISEGQEVEVDLLQTTIMAPTESHIEGEQVHVELSKPVPEAPTESRTLTLEEQLEPESSEDIKERMPSPEHTTEEQIQVELAEPKTEPAKPSQVQHVEEVHAEDELGSHIMELHLQLMSEEEIASSLLSPVGKTAEEAFVGEVEERQSPEKEEEMYYTAPEPPAPQEEVVVELEAKEGLQQEPTHISTQEMVTEVQITEEAKADFEEEKTKEEEIIVPLEEAEKELAKPSLVGTQEAVTIPLSAEEFEPEPVSEEVTEESKVEVELYKPAATAPEPSRTETQTAVVEVQGTREDVEEYDEEITMGEDIKVDLSEHGTRDRPLQLTGKVGEDIQPEGIAEEIVGNIKEVYMIPSLVRPEYEPSVVERYRLEARVRPQDRDQSVEITEQQRLMMHHQQLIEERTEEAEMVAAEMAQEIVRAAQEVTEEKQVITETVTEEVELIEKKATEEVQLVTEVTEKVDTVVSAMSLMAPVFEIPLSDVMVIDGEKAVLECRVTGVPKPEVAWFIENQEIKPSTDFKITYEDGYCTLVIMDVLPEDEGEYTVKAVNEAGTCITTAYLTVLPASASGSEPSSPSEVSETSIEPQLVKRSQTGLKKTTKTMEERHRVEVDISMQAKKVVTQEVTIPSAPEAPRFIKELEHKEIFESMPVTLYCDVRGYPEPQISWFQDGKKLTSTAHMNIEYTQGRCTLEIDKVTVEDEAEYMCEAKNEVGVATTISELLVEKLVSAVEQVILEEFYEIEIEMNFKWRNCTHPEALEYLCDSADEDLIA